jgi:molybdopterin molybdotransferase
MLTVLSVADARKKILSSVPGSGRKVDVVSLLDATNRILAKPLTAGCDLPPFPRSTMDGFAVSAPDTFGASEAMPALLTVSGEVLMGQAPPSRLTPGQALRISTGGMLPAGSDAVVMVEYTEDLGDQTIAVYHAVAPGENTILRGEDLKTGETVLPAGHRLRPQDIGALAALGCGKVETVARPQITILSTGDELVPPEREPGPGQVRDINSYLLASLVFQTGGIPKVLGIVPDRAEALYSALQKAQNSDCVILSGGSSAGTRDLTAETIDRLGQPGVLFHGVSMRPGKPLIFGVVGEKPFFGLSGNPTSALVGFRLFVGPLLLKLQGAEEKEPVLWARTERNLSSASGREDYFRAVVYNRDGELWAHPMLGQANLISTVVKGNALLRVPQNCEGVEAGEKLEVMWL